MSTPLAQTPEEKELAFRVAVMQKLDLITSALAHNNETSNMKFVELGVRLDTAISMPQVPVKRATKAAAAEKKAPNITSAAGKAAPAASATQTTSAAPAAEKPPVNTMYYFAWRYAIKDAEIDKFYSKEIEQKAIEEIEKTPAYTRATVEYDRRRMVSLFMWKKNNGMTNESKLALKQLFKNYQETADRAAAQKQVQPEAESDMDGDGAEV